MRYHSPLPPLAELQKVLYYDPETGVFTRNGKLAGHVQHGRRKIDFKGKAYFASRLAWLWMTGEDPGPARSIMPTLTEVMIAGSTCVWRPLRTTPATVAGGFG